MNEILNTIHKTIYQFFDVCEDDEEVPMSDKDKLLLEVNKAICNNLKALEQESVLDKIRAEIIEKFGNCSICEWFEDYDYEENNISEYQSVGDISNIIEIIDKYKAESEEV